MANISLTVKSNFDDAGRDIKRFGTLTESEAKRIERFTKKFKSTQIDSFIQKNNRAAAAVRATRGPLDAAITQQAGLRREMERLIRGGIDPQDKALEKLRAEYRRAGKSVQAMGKAQEFTQNSTRVATVALTAMSAAAAALGGYGVKFAMEYTRSMANVNTMIDMTTKEHKQLDAQLTRLSEKFAVQKKELSGGLYQALSAGASDLGEALDIVNASATLGRGALIDNASAVDIVTTAMNAYGAAAGSTTDVIDSYFTIIKEGKINGEELSSTIGQSISLFAAAKIPLDELGAGIATLTKVGVGASEATTQLNAMVNAFLKPSTEMTAELERMGHASGATFLEAEGLAGAIEFLNTAGGGTIESMSEMVPNIRGLRGALAAASQDGMVFNDVLASFTDKSGNAQEALERQTEGFAGSAFTVEQAKIVLQNLAITVGQKLLPVLARIAQKITNLIQNSARFKKTLDILIPVIAGVASGLVSFLVLAKIVAIVKTFTTAMAVLNAVMKANPVLLIAMAIAAVVAGIVVLIRNWDQVVVFISTTVEKLKLRFAQFGGAIKTGWVVAVNSIKSAFIGLGLTIVDNVLGAIQRFIDFVSKIPGVEKLLSGVDNKIDNLRAGLQAVRERAAAESRAVIDAARAEQKEKASLAAANIASINAERDARMAALKEQEIANEAWGNNDAVMGVPDSAAILPNAPQTGGGEELALKERLSVLHNAEAVAYNEQLKTFGDFLSARMDQEGIAGAERLLFLQEELTRINDLEGLSNAERLAAQDAVNQELIATEQALADARVAIRREELAQVSEFFGSMAGLIDSFGENSRGAAIGQKAFAAASAAINSYLAFTQVLADPSFIGRPWMRAIAAGSVLVAGLAQQIKILGTKIPSAETGGRFQVPSTGGRVDSVAVMANPGEEVNVSPRGEGRSLTVITEIDRKTIWRVTQEGIDSGKIRINNRNLRSA